MSHVIKQVKDGINPVTRTPLDFYVIYTFSGCALAGVILQMRKFYFKFRVDQISRKCYKIRPNRSNQNETINLVSKRGFQTNPNTREYFANWRKVGPIMTHL